MKLVKIVKSAKPEKKLDAVFEDNKGKTKTVSFGQAGAPDYTLTKDEDRRRLYLQRHRARENWNNPTTAGSLSKHILWGDSTSKKENIKSFKRKFNL